MEYVSEFKYLGCDLDESGTDEVECRRKVASGRRVAGAIRLILKKIFESPSFEEQIEISKFLFRCDNKYHISSLANN